MCSCNPVIPPHSHVVRAPALATAAPMTISAKVTGQNVVVPSDTEEDNTEDEASAASTAQPAQELLTVAETPSLDNNDMPADGKSSNKLAVGTMFGTEALAHLLRFFQQKQKKMFLYKGNTKTFIIPSSVINFAVCGLAQIRCNKHLKQHLISVEQDQLIQYKTVRF